MQLCCCITPNINIINIWNQNCVGICVKPMRVIGSGWFLEFRNGGSLNSKSKIFWLHKYNTCGAKKVTCIRYVYECIMFHLYIQKYTENKSCLYISWSLMPARKKKAFGCKYKAQQLHSHEKPTRQTYQKKKCATFIQPNLYSELKSSPWVTVSGWWCSAM